MIKINLAPLDEMESKFWYMPEVITIALILLITTLSVDFYLDGIREQIQLAQVEKSTLDENLSTIKQETARFDQLDADIEKLRIKLASLKEITSKKTTKFKQIIVLEHLLNLKPDGLWFSYISENSDLEQVTVVGKAFDNILIAEFMAAIQSTKIQEADPTDLRTQIYFSDLRLEKVAVGAGTGMEQSTEGAIEEKLKKEAAEGFWTQDNTIFPELEKFPTFQLTMQYSEKKPANEVLLGH